MTFDEASRQLATAGSKLPRSAMQWCLDHWDEAGPALVGILDRCASGERPRPNDADMLFFAVHLLGEKSEQAAFAPLCRLLLDRQTAEAVLGDAVTTTLARILISTYDGDLAALQAVIEAERADEFVRDAALGALSYLAATGRVAQEEMRAYLLHLRDEMQPQSENFVWANWVLAVARLGYADLTEQAQDLIRRGFVGSDVLGVSDFHKDLAQTLADPARMAGFEHDRLAPFTGAIEELARWHGFSETPAQPPARFLSPDTYINPLRELGRNDPCPCGSGRKYKKCCLATGTPPTRAVGPRWDGLDAVS